MEKSDINLPALGYKILTGLLPNYKRAFIALEKLSDDCLNLNLPVGKDKAIVFKSVLNFTEKDDDFLKTAIPEGLGNNESFPGIQDEFGKRYSVGNKNP